jgi:diacylglycerol kinase (ATP)
MRLALIANPRSGGTTDSEPLAAELRRHGADVSVHTPHHLDRVAADEPERLAVASGDGTVGRAAALAHTLDVPLAVIPAGTANDFARAQGLPRDIAAACALAATGTALRSLELGRLASGYAFVNVASAGLASAAAARASGLKRVLGPLAYAVGAARAGATEQPLACTILVDGEALFSGEAWQVIVGVTGAFGAGSNLGVTDPHDGHLDVAVVPATSRISLVRRAAGLRRGTITEQPGVCNGRGLAVELHAPPGTTLNVDGEMVRAAEPERLTAEADAYRLVVPE